MAVRQGCDPQRDQDDRRITGQDGEGTDETELLGHRREDEISVFFGQEFQLALAAQAEPLAQEAAGAQGDLGLHDVIARARRIGLRVQEGQHPVALILVHAEHHIGRNQRHGGGAHSSDDLPAQPRHEHDGRAGQADQHGRAQVRLVRHQQEGQADDGDRIDQLPVEAGLLGRSAVIPARQGQNDADLHDLGRLDARQAEVQPAGRAHGRITQARNLDQGQHQQGHPIDRIGQAEPEADIDHGQGQHQGHAHAEADQVFRRPRRPGPSADGIEHQCAGAGHHADQSQQTPVDLTDLGRNALALAGTGQGGSGHQRGSDR